MGESKVSFSAKGLTCFSHVHLLGFGVLGIIGAGLLLSAIIPDNARLHGSEIREVDKKTSLLDGQWDYLPGSRISDDGLELYHAGFSIVEQDGSGGAPNPQANLFGTRLDVVGDFVIEAIIKNVRGAASMQLYGRPPIQADEFRVERESVRIQMQKGELAVSLWDGTNQEPTSSQTFGFEPKDISLLHVKRQGQLLVFSVDGKELGSIQEKNIFKSGQLWFGIEAQKDSSWLLSDLSVEEINGGIVKLVDTATLTKTEQNMEGLQLLAAKKRPDFKVGAAIALAPLVSDAEFAHVALDKNNFGSWTPENAMKMQFVRPQENMYDFRGADALVKLAEKHRIDIHGHALVFGEANPPWFNALPVKTSDEKKHIEYIMLDHISKMTERFKDKVKTWDVVNEPLADEGGLRKHKWYQAMGESYIAKAFHAAHQADPDALLFINDYGLESGDEARWNEFVGLLTRLQNQKVPIHGVGMQAHVYVPRDRIDPQILRARTQQLAKLHLKVRISEMDVYGDKGAEEQAQQYKEIFAVALGEPNVISWTAWIMTNRYDVYKDDAGTIRYGNTGLYDKYLYPTLAIHNMQKVAIDK